MLCFLYSHSLYTMKQVLYYTTNTNSLVIAKRKTLLLIWSAPSMNHTTWWDTMRVNHVESQSTATFIHSFIHIRAGQVMDTEEVEWACETVEWACERGTRVTSSAGQHSGWSSRSQSLRLLETSSAEMGPGKVFKMGRGGVPEYTHLPVGETRP